MSGAVYVTFFFLFILLIIIITEEIFLLLLFLLLKNREERRRNFIYFNLYFLLQGIYNYIYFIITLFQLLFLWKVVLLLQKLNLDSHASNTNRIAPGRSGLCTIVIPIFTSLILTILKRQLVASPTAFFDIRKH